MEPVVSGVIDQESAFTGVGRGLKREVKIGRTCCAQEKRYKTQREEGGTVETTRKTMRPNNGLAE